MGRHDPAQRLVLGTTPWITARRADQLVVVDRSRLGTVTIHATFHVTYADANGNFAPDPGEFGRGRALPAHLPLNDQLSSPRPLALDAAGATTRQHG
jgi:hypothetical protein